MLRRLLRADHLQHGRRADDQRHRHFLAALLVFHPVVVRAAVGLDEPHGGHPVGRLQAAAVLTDVLDAAVEIVGDPQAGGKIRGRVPARRVVGHGQRGEALALPALQGVAGDDDLVDRSLLRRNLHRGDRILESVRPLLIDFLRQRGDVVTRIRDAERGRVDGERTGGAADHDIAIALVAAPFAVGDVGEEKGALGVGVDHRADVADIAPPHEGMQVLVLVDRLIDRPQEPRLVELLQMCVQIVILTRKSFLHGRSPVVAEIAMSLQTPPGLPCRHRRTRPSICSDGPFTWPAAVISSGR